MRFAPVLSIYSMLPEHLRAKVDLRRRIIEHVSRLEAEGRTRSAAIALASAKAGVAARTVWTWRGAIWGSGWYDMSSALSPRHLPSVRRLVLECLGHLPRKQRRATLLAALRSYPDEAAWAFDHIEAARWLERAGAETSGGGATFPTRARSRSSS